ncbi:MAG TPA: 2-phosphosulfolactate phosphatase [Bacteroidales bacterium]|nr:2-phosphosulfolactate phosphatase [Bacteroidales bacterium]
MNIQILHLIEGARKATGLTVVIDVFRAFSVAPYAFANGVDKIIPVGSLEKAQKLKAENPTWLLAGERHEQKVPGFDFGNSPSQILEADLQGKTLIHTTSAGTQGLVNAVNAGEILTGSFVNAGAIINYIKTKQPETVSLVCMGYSTQYPVEEDTFCAEYIKNELEERKNNFDEMVSIIRQTSGARFFDEEKQTFAPSSDFDLCLSLNRFDFVIKAKKTVDGYELRMATV